MHNLNVTPVTYGMGTLRWQAVCGCINFLRAKILSSGFFLLITKHWNAAVYSCPHPLYLPWLKSSLGGTASKKIYSVHRSRRPLKAIPGRRLLEGSENVLQLCKSGSSSLDPPETPLLMWTTFPTMTSEMCHPEGLSKPHQDSHPSVVKEHSCGVCDLKRFAINTPYLNGKWQLNVRELSKGLIRNQLWS